MMNKNQIGTNAGIVWKLLSDNAHWEYDKLKHASGLSDRDLNAAIFWRNTSKAASIGETAGVSANIGMVMIWLFVRHLLSKEE